MKLELNKNLLSVEGMRKVIELVDSGVLVDIDQELIKSIQNAPDEDIIFPVRKAKRGRKAKKAMSDWWTEKEVNKLKKLRDRGVKYKKIALKLGKTYTQVKDKIGNLKKAGRWEDNGKVSVGKLKKPRKKGKRIVKNPYFTKDMKKLLIMLKEERLNMTYRKIAGMLNKKFGTSLTAQQVKEKYRKIRR